MARIQGAVTGASAVIGLPTDGSWASGGSGITAAMSIADAVDAVDERLAREDVTADTDGATLLATEAGRTITNEGAAGETVFNLPVPVAGLKFTFIVHTAQNLKVVASTGVTIRIADQVSGAAGHVQSATIGSVIPLLALNTTEWFAVPAPLGTWEVV